MSVKVAPAPGAIVEEVKRTRTIPQNSPDNDTDKPWRVLDKWDYLASLTPEAMRRDNIGIYLYRYDEKGNAWGIGKFPEGLDEFKVMEMFGGGRFNLKVKRGPQLVINEDFQLEGPQKIPGVNSPASSNGNGAPQNESALLLSINALIEELRASRGGTVAQDAIKSAMSLQGQVFGAGVETIRGTLAAGGGQASSMKDTLEILTVAKALFAPATPGPATNSVKDTLEMISALKNAGIFGGGGEGKLGITAELIRQLPTVTHNLVQGIQSWAMAEDARARQAAYVRGPGAPPITVNATPGPPANVVPINGTPAAAAQPPADAPPPAPPVHVEVPQMPIETLEQMLCNIIADQNRSTEEAANEAATLIERSMPGMTDRMISQGEEWLMGLFSTRPVLQQVSNHPRLREFVKKFIEVVKAAPVLQPANPAAPVA
jgi:hypothetical protein